jgi:hypothetical protein
MLDYPAFIQRFSLPRSQHYIVPWPAWDITCNTVFGDLVERLSAKRCRLFDSTRLQLWSAQTKAALVAAVAVMLAMQAFETRLKPAPWQACGEQ